MTSTMAGVFFPEPPNFLQILFAQESDPDKDLDFDEGLEDDDLHQSKPPSRRPLLWIILVLLAIGVAYWTLSPTSSPTTSRNSMDTAEATKTQQPLESISSFSQPIFQENQKVSLLLTAGDATLMADLSNSKPGPSVKSGEILTILDGAYQSETWVYLVQTSSGKTGWISGNKLKKHS